MYRDGVTFEDIVMLYNFDDHCADCSFGIC